MFSSPRAYVGKECSEFFQSQNLNIKKESSEFSLSPKAYIEGEITLGIFPSPGLSVVGGIPSYFSHNSLYSFVFSIMFFKFSHISSYFSHIFPDFLKSHQREGEGGVVLSSSQPPLSQHEFFLQSPIFYTCPG